MIRPSLLINLFKEYNIDFFTGVPDSQLKEICGYLLDEYGINDRHIIAPNEGNAVALAAGHYLATNKIGMVYMQNSGLGNAVNPITSLADERVYAIPILYMIGWRGMPGVHDEPQHIKQGAITLQLLELLGIDYFIIDKTCTVERLKELFIKQILPAFSNGRSFALVTEKDVFEQEGQYKFGSHNVLTRERATEVITESASETDVFISTTGKLSRELYEQRDQKGQGHERDFLTVGSMGHASMLALKIALDRPERRVYCLDGDGAMLMHMGTMALIGANKPRNLVHVVINNNVHESVGGFPTVISKVDIGKVGLACGYDKVIKVDNEEDLLEILKDINSEQKTILLEVYVNTFARHDLGRPKTTPVENKNEFMSFLQREGE
jgi:phosphonopyruvate decarboxylase